MPGKPMAGIRTGAAGNRLPGPPTPRDSTTEKKMLSPFTRRSATIGRTVSCTPINQPLSAKSERVAGAAQIRM